MISSYRTKKCNAFAVPLTEVVEALAAGISAPCRAWLREQIPWPTGRALLYLGELRHTRLSVDPTSIFAPQATPCGFQTSSGIVNISFSTRDASTLVSCNSDTFQHIAFDRVQSEH